MGAFLVALLSSLSASVWVYVKLQQRTGYGNNRPAAMGAAVVGALLFIIIYMTASLFDM